jgi:hypothetical protein
MATRRTSRRCSPRWLIIVVMIAGSVLKTTIQMISHDRMLRRNAAAATACPG